MVLLQSATHQNCPFQSCDSAKQPTTATQRAMAESTQPPRREAARNADEAITRAANDSSDSDDTVNTELIVGYDAAREPAPLAVNATVVWHVTGFSPRRSTAFRRAGWAPWRMEVKSRSVDIVGAPRALRRSLIYLHTSAGTSSSGWAGLEPATPSPTLSCP